MNFGTFAGISQGAVNGVTSDPPFGQAIPLWDNRLNPTIDGVEYLKSGTLKSISGYEQFASAWPSFTCNVAPGSIYTVTRSTTGPTSVFYLYNGTNYFTFNNGTNSAYYGTNVTSNWTTALGSPARADDACRFGENGTVIVTVNTSDATNNRYVSGASTTLNTISTIQLMQVCAANSAGTLGVLVGSLGGAPDNIWTSTNGTSWTSRTPSGGGGTPFRATWCKAANCFIYLDGSRGIYTATDGFTLTSRGTYSTTYANSGAPGNNLYCASSPTSTLICIGTTQANGAILRTTDAVTFTAYSIPSLFPELLPSVGTVPKLRYIDGAYYAIFSTNYVFPDSGIYRSTDDGLTWVQVPAPVLPGYVNTGSTMYIVDDLVSLNNNIIAFVVVSTNSATGYYGVLQSPSAPTHIGLPVGTRILLTNAAGQPVGYTTNYVRIK